ncbi:MAG: hypothetical protein R6U89_07790, partial [Dehalococcoidia bacterium]
MCKTNRKRSTLEIPDELDILSAMWVLSCNDENPLMAYQGIIYRLGLPPNYDVENLVKPRADLFRRKVTSSRLEEWKQEMLAGKRIPAWIKAIHDEDTRRKTIQSLSPDDIFRSQFR